MNRFVYVIDWGKHYTDITWYNPQTQKRENYFPIKTKLPPYCEIDFHWEYVYEPNFTKKGTINKREPKKLVSKSPIYKNYKWEIIETFKHPKAGELSFDPDKYTQEQIDSLKSYLRYPEGNLLLLASTHTDKDWMKCYIVIGEDGVSELTPEQYADELFNATIEGNCGKWNRNNLNKEDIPEEIISVFYDKNDRVLFGSSMTKGLVSYEYIDGKFSVDRKHIYLGASILYDGKGNEACPNPELIKEFSWIKKYLEGHEDHIL